MTFSALRRRLPHSALQHLASHLFHTQSPSNSPLNRSSGAPIQTLTMTPPKMLLDLPPDILLKICQHVVPTWIDDSNIGSVFSNVCALAGTCRTFRKLMRLQDVWEKGRIFVPIPSENDDEDDENGDNDEAGDQAHDMPVVNAQTLFNELAPYARHCVELGVPMTSGADVFALASFLPGAKVRTLGLSFSDSVHDAPPPAGPWLPNTVASVLITSHQRSELVQGALHALCDIKKLCLMVSDLAILGDVGGVCNQLKVLDLDHCGINYGRWAEVTEAGLELPSVTTVQIRPPMVEGLFVLWHTPNVRELALLDADVGWPVLQTGPLNLPPCPLARLSLSLGGLTIPVTQQLARFLAGGVEVLELAVHAKEAEWLVPFLKDCPVKYEEVNIRFIGNRESTQKVEEELARAF